MENKTKRSNLRLTPDDKKTIENNAKKMGLKISDYARYTLIKNKPLIIKNIIELEPIEKAFGNLEYQVNKLGNNVNQIAKNLNQGGTVKESTINDLINVMNILNKRLEVIENEIIKAYKIFD